MQILVDIEDGGLVQVNCYCDSDLSQLSAGVSLPKQTTRYSKTLLTTKYLKNRKAAFWR